MMRVSARLREAAPRLLKWKYEENIVARSSIHPLQYQGKSLTLGRAGELAIPTLSEALPPQKSNVTTFVAQTSVVTM